MSTAGRRLGRRSATMGETPAADTLRTLLMRSFIKWSTDRTHARRPHSPRIPSEEDRCIRARNRLDMVNRGHLRSFPQSMHLYPGALSEGTTTAGFPKAVACDGTSFATTAPAPTF